MVAKKKKPPILYVAIRDYCDGEGPRPIEFDSVEKLEEYLKNIHQTDRHTIETVYKIEAQLEPVWTNLVDLKVVK